MLRRKIDNIMIEWKNRIGHKPLIVKGARQIGKTESIRHFGNTHYKYMVEINFALQKKYMSIFDDGYEVEDIIKNITFIEPSIKLIPRQTLIFFDELQDNPDCATSLKSFMIDAIIENIMLRKSIMLICDDKDVICDYIINVLGKSATYVEARGAYTGERNYIVFSTLTKKQAIELRGFIHQNKLHAFMSVMSTSEVFGKGFSSL